MYEHSLEILRSKTRVLFAVIDGKQQKVFLAESMKDRRLKVMKKAPSSPMQGRRKGIEPQKRSMFFCFFPRDSQQTLRETRNSNQMSVYYSFFCFVHGTPSHEYIYIYICNTQITKISYPSPKLTKIIYNPQPYVIKS